MNDLGIGRIRRENQRLFLNANEVHGLQSINGNWDNGLGVLKFLSMNCAQIIPVGAAQASLSVLSFVVDTDPYIRFTGNFGLNAYVIREKTNVTNNFGFTSGYLTNYKSKCAIGEIPQLEANFVVYGQAGQISSTETPETPSDFSAISTYNSNFGLNIAGPGKLSINIDDFATNRLQSYELNISVARAPQYILGKRNAHKVEINYPLLVDLAVSYELDSYTPKKMLDFPCDPTVKNVQINLNQFVSGTTILSYNFNDMFLVGEPYNINIDGNLIVTSNYRTYLTRT